jgi:hypothetical protein
MECHIGRKGSLKGTGSVVRIPEFILIDLRRTGSTEKDRTQSRNNNALSFQTFRTGSQSDLFYRRSLPGLNPEVPPASCLHIFFIFIPLL